MVKRKKSKNTEAAADAGASALTETPVVNSARISSNLAPSKKIKKDGKKGEGASGVLTNPTPTPTPNPNSSKEEKKEKVAGFTPTPNTNSSKEEKKEKEKEKEKDAGFIFMCNARTKPECYKHGVFGMPKGKSELAERIKPGTWLFLYDFDSRLMHGIYKAISKGGVNFVPTAFGGAFPAQVKFKIDKDCLPLPESNFRSAIVENYVSPTKFEQDLNSIQVNKLVALFKPITAGSQPAATQVTDARHAHRPPYLPPPSDLYRSTHHPPAHLPPADDPYRPKMHPAPAHLLSSVEPYLTHAPVHESRYLPSHVPRPVNDRYNPAHYLHAPFSGFQPSGPHHPQPPSYLYQAEAGRAYYENPIPSDRLGYRMLSDMPPVDPNASAAHRAREYYLSLVTTGGGAVPHAAVDDPYGPHLLTSNSSITNLNPQPQLLASYIQQLSSAPANQPVSSRYSFAGGYF